MHAGGDALFNETRMRALERARAVDNEIELNELPAVDPIPIDDPHTAIPEICRECVERRASSSAERQPNGALARSKLRQARAEYAAGAEDKNL